MAYIERDLDSRTYRKLLEFIQKEGVESVWRFWASYKSIQDRSLLMDALCKGKHHTLSLVINHKAVTGFIKELGTYNSPCFLHERNFPEFLRRLARSDISSQIEGARCLEELGVHSISLKFDDIGAGTYDTYIHYDEDNIITNIVKYYSNGTISYREKENGHADWESYLGYINFSSNSGNFVLQFDNVGDQGCKRAWVTDFTFDTSLLPSEEELSRMAVPKTLTDSKVYVKR